MFDSNFYTKQPAKVPVLSAVTPVILFVQYLNVTK